MKNTLHILTGLALAITLASCGKTDDKKAEGAAAAPAAATVPAGDLENIELVFPKPMFIGTPVPAELPNLEKADPSKVVKSFQAPKGTTNLAKGKPVTSSDAAPIIGELGLVTDGDPDGADGSFVELMPGKQWVQIDLGAPANLYKIAMWHYHKQAQAYIDVVVQVSDDPEFKAGVTTLFNSDHDDTSALGKGADPAYVETNHGRVVDAKGLKARYVRLWSNGNTSNDMNHYCEVEVFGTPAK
ncbi:MAG: discoidin domain-containing protein [Prosthecobacter sp.]|uniref:discoidin domain-containing protein n=1 Tax=Prosthecobacter sp. TaxID=1965333 RepID=UPI0039010941